MLSARTRGLTLIELMTVTAVLAVFLTLMLPSLQTQVLKTRRSDALQAIGQVQQRQERWRGQQPTYAPTLADLGLAGASPAGYYAVSVQTDTETQASRYVVSVAASGAQAADQPCRHLRVIVDGGLWQESSGPDTGYGNDPAGNRRCWNR